MYQYSTLAPTDPVYQYTFVHKFTYGPHRFALYLIGRRPSGAKAATVISKRISGSGDIGNDSLDGLLTLGAYLVRHHCDVCKHGVMVDSPEDIQRLEAWFDEAIERQGRT